MIVKHFAYNLLCTLNSTTIEGVSGSSRDGEVKVPPQLYSPLCDVFSGLKISVEMAVSFVNTMIPFPLVTATPPVVHVAVGELIKPPTVLDTVQVRL